MQKTNIRLNNFFILENKSKYFLTDIDQLEDWKDFQSKKLKQFLSTKTRPDLETNIEQDAEGTLMIYENVASKGKE